MNLFLILFVACAGQIVAATNEDIDNLWEEFKATQGKKFASPQGEAKRKSNFVKSHRAIQSVNKASRSFSCDHNHMSDWTPEEKSILLGKVTDPSRSASVEEIVPTVFAADSTRELPNSFDLRSNSTCVGPIRDQGQCGSCWAFSAIAPLEWSLCKKTGELVDLSEQQLVSCDTKDSGCDGGDTAYNGPWQYLKSAKNGVMSEKGYPYTGFRSRCKYDNKRLSVKSLKTFGHVNPDVTSIQTAMIKYGVLSTCVYVDGDTFFHYSDGVYKSDKCGTKVTNHCVALVGWTVINDERAWIMRNTWGPGWGVDGYMYIKQGEDMCGIEREVGFVQVS